MPISIISQNQSSNNFEWLTKSDFLKKVYNYEENPTVWKYLGNKPAVILFAVSDDWCKPCENSKAVFSELSTKYKDKVLFYMVDVYKEEELMEAFDAKTFPKTLFIPLNGEPLITIGILEKTMCQKAIDETLLKNN